MTPEEKAQRIQALLDAGSSKLRPLLDNSGEHQEGMLLIAIAGSNGDGFAIGFGTPQLMPREMAYDILTKVLENDGYIVTPPMPDHDDEPYH